MLSDWIK